MNIFVLDENPALAAKYLNNKHTVKMILESTQLLCTALNLNGIQTPYKSTHMNHPCSIWTRESSQNWLWLYDHAIAIGREYSIRYHKIHKCESVLENIKEFNSILPQKELTSFAICMPDEFKVQNNAVLSYRNYYMKAKRDISEWKTTPPFWWI